ncbi:carbamoyltransferase C-terminal domain-containing protein [Micromonospora echinaurantiaca]|uniref:carbamoyltransferase C-terminal domain-containing protein n=1 Tax=Micromonospora echinaurantiaca TaxID=47857 RepID=UPI003711C184
MSAPLICGLKMTHDGGFAIVEGDRLLLSVEAEKLENRERHATFNRSADIAARLRDAGISPADLTSVVIDGWARGRENESWVEVIDDAGTARPVEVAGYDDAPADSPRLLDGRVGSSPLFGPAPTEFRSFSHATDHAFASYCTSDVAARDEPALMLVWDGGMAPNLYHYDPRRRAVRAYGPVAEVSGGIYPIFASHFGPFRVDHSRRLASNPGPGMEALLPVSGKAMAYASLDPPSEEAVKLMEGVTAAMLPIDRAIKSYGWSRRVQQEAAALGLSDAALLASFQEHLFRVLVDGLKQKLAELPELDGLPICLSGGCALNIKWNAGLRASGLFADVWVPPFPNDAGSAIGAACVEMIRSTGRSALRWSVFAGPPVTPIRRTPAGWSSRPCEIEELAKLLEEQGEPVVVVHGPAELGPRALGHRSIIAPATSAAMKDRLNAMKGREWYRPVAPICLQDRAPEVFSPGTRDPYMLFDHSVRPEWKDRIPAVVHLDGSARLQTVDADNPTMHRLLTAYERLTGIPVLCNTSANFKGSGFFPDAASAMRWGQARYVWSEGVLHWTDAAPAAG